MFSDQSFNLQSCNSLYKALVKYGCKNGCTGQCKCLKSGLKLTEWCQLFGQCINGKSS